MVVNNKEIFLERKKKQKTVNMLMSNIKIFQKIKAS